MTPSHYTHTQIEPIKVINSINLGFNLGSAYKYLARAGHKGSKAEDLKKAIDFIGYEIEQQTFFCDKAKLEKMKFILAKEDKDNLVYVFLLILIQSQSTHNDYTLELGVMKRFLESILQKSAETTTTKD